MPHRSLVTVAELLSSGEPPRPEEAVAIVIELCTLVIARRAADAVDSAISPSTVSLEASGAVWVAGGVPGEDEQTVSLVGHLLVEMLGHRGGEPDRAVPPRLRATAIRAATSGREAYASLSHLVAALKRHAPDQKHAAIRTVFDRWRAAAGRPWEGRPSGRSVAARLLREAEEEARRSPFTESGRGAGAPCEASDEATAGPSRAWFARALVAGMTLLLLAGAGVFFLYTGDRSPVPTIVPRSRPIPASPHRDPGWELLGKPERVSGTPEPGATTPHRSAIRVRAGIPAPPPEPNDASHSASIPRQSER
jgi:hypothetical protein